MRSGSEVYLPKPTALVHFHLVLTRRNALQDALHVWQATTMIVGTLVQLITTAHVDNEDPHAHCSGRSAIPHTYCIVRVVLTNSNTKLLGRIERNDGKGGAGFQYAGQSIGTLVSL